jgi:hypothetical protein
VKVDTQAVLVVHAVITLFYLATRRFFPAILKRGFIGYYLVLMPLGFIVWMDPSLWYVAALSVAGLGLITFSARRLVEERGESG